MNENEVMRTDGKRRVSIKPGYAIGNVDVSVCINGHQTIVTTMDVEMLSWLSQAIDEYLQRLGGESA
jgi:hypothetical protein